MKYTQIRVRVARSLEAIESGECDDVRECDTVKEAKAFARYSLTEAYRQSGEFSELMNCARVDAFEAISETSLQRVCLADYQRKGWSPAPDV